MATTTTPGIAPVLRGAADLLAGLPYARVTRTDVHQALRQAGGDYRSAQAALVELHRHVRRADDVELLAMLVRWSKPLSRDLVAERLRAAADAEQADGGEPR